MNFYVFMNVAQFDVVPDSMIQIMSTTDNIGAVLRSHLICEQLAEAWYVEYVIMKMFSVQQMIGSKSNAMPSLKLLEI